MTKEKEITIYHSPDADDAFMFYGLVKDVLILQAINSNMIFVI
jgi:predicted solute-binding protein